MGTGQSPRRIVQPAWFTTHPRAPDADPHGDPSRVRSRELEFLSFHENQPSEMLVVLVGAAEPRASPDVTNSAVERLWPAITSRFPTWRGERMNIGELWFFADGLASVREGLAHALRSGSEVCDVRAAAFTAPADARARLRALDRLGVGLIANAPSLDGFEIWRVVGR